MSNTDYVHALDHCFVPGPDSAHTAITIVPRRRFSIDSVIQERRLFAYICEGIASGIIASAHNPRDTCPVALDRNRTETGERKRR